MINLNRIVDIAIYRGESELICTQCGSVNGLTEANVVVTTSKDYKKRYHAQCPDCLSIVKQLKSHKAERIFWRGSMVEVPKLDTSLIMWMLNNNFNHDKHKEELFRELKARMREPVQLKLTETPDVYIKSLRSYLKYLSDELRGLHAVNIKSMARMDRLTLKEHWAQLADLEKELTHFNNINNTL